MQSAHLLRVCGDRGPYLENGEPRPEVRSFDRGPAYRASGPVRGPPGCQDVNPPRQLAVSDRARSKNCAKSAHPSTFAFQNTLAVSRKQMTPDGKPGAIW